MAGAGSAEKLNKNGAGVYESEPQKDVFGVATVWVALFFCFCCSGERIMV